MTEICRFDSVAGLEDSDCWQACLFKGCTPELLGNHQCDSECAAAECGFDAGDCGICAGECTLYIGTAEILGNSVCDAECDSEACGFDGGDCGMCARGCFFHMLGNGICDAECLSESCANDMPDCTSLQCSEGCYPNMLSDGTCEPSCAVAPCHFDSPDCDCAPGCSLELLRNADCDPQCANAACGFDSNICVLSTQGDCASGCFTVMRGDGNCDWECNNEACAWDQGDCGCAEGCSESDYGHCHNGCLRPDCHYDAVPGFAACSDQIATVSARLYHLLSASFEAVYSYEDQCLASTPSCTPTKWQLSINSCVSECSSLPCLGSFGNCAVSCPAGCSKCIDSLLCVSCDPGFLQFFTQCVLECPVTYHPSEGLCLGNSVDPTTVLAPAEFFVSSEVCTTAIGSQQRPFDSLSVALAAAHHSHTRVLLMRGVHALTALMPSGRMFRWKDSSFFPSAKPLSIRIEAMTCAEFPTAPECSEPPPTLMLSNVSPALLRVEGKVEIRGLVLTGNAPLLLGCSDAEMCSYCPTVAQGDTASVDDRGHPISEYAPRSACAQFHDYNLLTVSSAGQLVLWNCTITNFRQEFASLVHFSQGSVSIADVLFANITTSLSVISQSGGSGGLSELLLDSVRVELLGNGYEYSPSSSRGGILSLSALSHIAITNSHFYGNLAIGALLAAKDFYTFSLRNCTFALNVGTLVLIQSSVALPKTPAYIEDVASRINIANCTYRNNTGTAISITLLGDALRTLITDCLFENSLSVGGNLISVQVGRPLTRLETTGGKVGLYQDGKRLSVTANPSNFTFTSINITASSASLLLSLVNIPHLTVSEVHISQCGDSRRSINSVTLKGLAAVPGSYLSLLYQSAESQPCLGLLTLVSVANASLSHVAVTSNTCSSGPAGLAVSATTLSLEISSSQFLSNTGMFAGVLDLQLSVPTSLRQVVVVNNTALAGAVSAVADSASGELFVSHSTFAGNSVSDGGTVNVNGKASFYESDFSSNACSGATAAGLVFTPSTYGSELVLEAVTFYNNTALTGAAIMLIDKLATRIPLGLSITKSTFELNLSSGYGSCILIDSTVRLSNSSIIYSSVFKNNTSANGLIWVSFSSGNLTIDNCLFRGNIGGNAVNLFCQHPRSVVPGIPSVVEVKNTVMEYGTGFASVYFSNPTFYTEGRSSNLTTRYNNGRSLFLQYTYWQDSNSFCHNNTSSTAGSCGIIMFFSAVTLANSTYENNSAVLTAGALTISVMAKIVIINCTFIENSSERGGALYVEQGAIMTIRNSLFLRNHSMKEGSAIYLFTGPLTTANSTISASIFTENESKSGSGTISLITSFLIADRVTMARNKAVSATGFLLYLSILSMTNSKLSSQQCQEGVFVLSAATSSINITNCEFAQGVALEKAAAIFVSSSTLYLSASRFTDLMARSGTVISALSNSVVVTQNCVFWNITARENHGGALHLTESTLRDQASTFSAITNGAIVGGIADIDIFKTEFRSATSLSGAGLYCENCGLVRISYAVFSSLTATVAPGVYLSSSTGADSLSMTSTVFSGGRSESAGAVYLQGLHANITNCTFSSNTAASGDAGSLLLSCSQADCAVVVAYSRFEKNTATRSGGAIYWSDRKPTLMNVTFDGNQAEYGNDVASFAVSLSAGDNETYHLVEVASGQLSKELIEVKLVDHYGQVVTTDNQSLADFLPSNSQNESLAGATRMQSVLGRYRFADFTITAEPGKLAEFLIVSNAIDADRVVLADLQIPFRPQVAVVAHMRNCSVGESQMGTACFICPEGKYSLTPSSACANCPSGAICYGGSMMAPKAGYWRSTTSTDVFLECPNQDSCLGADTDPISPTGKCLRGYYGNLCQGCVSGYTRRQLNYCSKCPSDVINGLQIAGVLLGVSAACIFIIKMSLISAQKQQSHSSIFLKIFVNYLQLTAATCSFNMNWPKYALDTFKTQENVANVNMQLFSFDCFLDNGSETNQADTFYLKAIFVAVLPVGIVAVSFLFWGCVGVIYRSKGYLKYQMVNSIVVLFFIAHPSIITFMYDVFSCREIDPGEYWLNSYLNIRCWDAKHSKYAMSAALPSLLLWGVCTPLMALLSLVSLRKRLLEIQIRIRLGFLYTGYENSQYYWEFVILYRKMIVITLSIFLTRVSTIIQVLSILLVLIFAYVLHARNSPYNAAVFNQLERRSILVAAATLYCGLYYMSGSLDYYTKITLFVVILLFNAYFLVLWLARLGEAGLHLLAKYCPFFRRFLVSFRYLTDAKRQQVQPGLILDHDGSYSFDRSSSILGVSVHERIPNAPQNSMSDPNILARHSKKPATTGLDKG